MFTHSFSIAPLGEAVNRPLYNGPARSLTLVNWMHEGMPPPSLTLRVSGYEVRPAPPAAEASEEGDLYFAPPVLANSAARDVFWAEKIDQDG